MIHPIFKNKENYIASLKGGYQVGIIFIISGLITLFIPILSSILITIGTQFIVFQKFRENKLMIGLLTLILGPITLGILPLIIAYRSQKYLNFNYTQEIEISTQKYIQDSVTMYKFAKKSLIVSIITFGATFFVFNVIDNGEIVKFMFNISLFTLILGNYIIIIQKLKFDDIKQAILFFFLIPLTIGILGIFIAQKNINKLNKKVNKISLNETKRIKLANNSQVNKIDEYDALAFIKSLDEENLNSKTIQELKIIAKNNNIKLKSNLKKAEIIEIIEERVDREKKDYSH